METTMEGKRLRAGRSVAAAVDDAALLRAVEALDPECGSVDDAPRRWQKVAERMVADTGYEASPETYRKRYEELVYGVNIDDDEMDDSVKQALDTHKKWLGSAALRAVVEGEETPSTGARGTTGSDVASVKSERNKTTPTKRASEKPSVVKTEPGLSMTSPPGSEKKRKTSASPASAVKRKSLLARVTATRHRLEKRLSVAASGDDAMESLAARVARNPQEVRIIPSLAKASPVSKSSPVVTPAKQRRRISVEKPNDVFFTPSKPRRQQEETKTDRGEADTVSEASKTSPRADGGKAEDDGSEQTEDTRTPEKTPTRRRRSNAKKVAHALLDAMIAVATTPPRSAEVDTVGPNDEEMKTTEEPMREAPAESSSMPPPVDQLPRRAEAAARSEATAVTQEEEIQSSTTTAVENNEEAMELDDTSMGVVESEGEKEVVQPSASPLIEFEAVDEDLDAGEAVEVAENTKGEVFASREEMAELKETVATLVSSLTVSKTEQASLKEELAGMQKSLLVCKGVSVVLQQEVRTLMSSLFDAQVRNAKLHEEVVLLREEIQRGRAEFQQQLAEIPSKEQSEGKTSTVTSSFSPSELQDIRELLRVHMESVMAAQETRKAAVAAGFSVIDCQLQQLQAAIDRGDQKSGELSAAIDNMRASIGSQLESQLKTYQMMLEEEQQNREEVLATVEREREELERERRKQYQQYQATVDEERRKREEMLSSFNENSQRELERLRDAADINLRARNELLFNVKGEREQTKNQNRDRVHALEKQMASLNESLLGVQVGLREHREQARTTRVGQQQDLETLKLQIEQLQAVIDKKPYENIKLGSEGADDGCGLNREIEALSLSLAQLQDSLSKQKQANKLRAMEQDSQTKIERSELRRTLETERSERMRDFSKLLTIVRQSQAGEDNESE